MKRYSKIISFFLTIIIILSNFIYASEDSNISTAIEIENEDKVEEKAESFSANTENSLTFGNFNYLENADGTIKITKYTGNEQNVSVPSTINGKKVTVIGAAAFSSKTSIKTVTIPNTVTDLETGAFMYCKNLTNITLGNSVKSLGDCVFESCGLEEIKIPASVTSINVRAFWDCSALSKIEVDNANTTFCSIDGILFSKDKTKLCSYPKAKTNTTYTIPSTVKELENYSFENNKYLQNVTIPNSVTTLDYGVFYKATALTSIVLPSSITKMDFSCFEMATGLKNVVINTQTSSIPFSCFKGCTNLVNVDATNCTANLINDDTFKECTRLTQIKLPSKLECIREGAFADCSSLTTLEIPDSILLIEKDFNLGCEKLTNIDLPAGIEKAEIAEANGKTMEAIRIYQQYSDGSYYERKAQLRLGQLYESFPKEAYAHYLRAAELGDSEAAFCVAYMSEYGEGTSINIGRAVTYYTNAASAGHRGAAHNLGFFYYSGTGVKKDLKRAFDLFCFAAKRGKADSMRNLGVMYENGDYVKKNLETALSWYSKSVEYGNVEAEQDCQRIRMKKKSSQFR